MSVSYQQNKITYVGNGSNTNFPMPFEIQDANTLYVYRRDETDPAAITETLLTVGSGPGFQDYYLTGVDPVNGVICTGITTNFVPTSTQKIILKRILPLQQGLSFPLNGPFPATDNEKGLDRSAMFAQQLQEQLDRAPKFSSLSPTTNITFPEPSDTMPLIGWKADKSGLENKEFVGIPVDTSTPDDGAVPVYDAATGKFTFASGVSGATLLGPPADGAYGGPLGPIAGVAIGDTIADAFDKIETVLGKLAPAPPADLSTKTLSIAGSYSAIPAGSTVTVSNVIDSTTPTISASNFSDGDSGTLSAEIDAVQVGSQVLTTADDTGTYGQLQITSDDDPYSGQAGKAGFWKELSASILNPVAIALGMHSAQLKHTATGNTPVLTFYCDDPGTPTISNTNLGSSGTSTLVSGVPGLSAGQTITATWDVANAVRTHYNATRVGRVQAVETPSYDIAPAGPYANGATLSLSQAMIVSSGKHTESFSATFYGYNSKGGSGTASLTSNIRIDTISDESVRSKSGQGQYPTKGSTAAQYGDPFDSTALLTAAGNEELQVIGGVYQFPPATDYSTLYPVGPNYTTVVGGSYSNYRWATFDTGVISAASNVTVALNGATNFGASTAVSGLVVQVAVVGASGTVGWVDANAAYPGVGNPTNNGDPAMVTASSTPSQKLVTFGASPKTGNVWVRVGIPSGSNKTFTGVTRG